MTAGRRRRQPQAYVKRTHKTLRVIPGHLLFFPFPSVIITSCRGMAQSQPTPKSCYIVLSVLTHALWLWRVTSMHSGNMQANSYVNTLTFLLATLQISVIVLCGPLMHSSSHLHGTVLMHMHSHICTGGLLTQ